MTEPPSEKRSTLRILSANLLEGRSDTRALAELIARFDVDVAAFQEFAGKHEAAIRDLLPHGETPVAGTPNMALALRHPAHIEAVAGSPRDLFAARLEPGPWDLRAPIEVISAHVRAPHLLPPWQTFATRRRQLEALAGRIRENPGQSRALVGDLNATPWWPVYRRLAHLLEDAAIVHAQRRGGRPQATWAPQAAGPRRLRLDHALVRGLRVVQFELLPIPGSDHRGMLLEVALPD